MCQQINKRNLKRMKTQLYKNKQTSKKYWLMMNGKARTPVIRLTGHLIKMCLTVMVMMALMMTSYAQTQTQQQTPLTVPELKKLLRQSLDREKVLNERLDAAVAHVDSLDKQIVDQKTDKAVDAERIKNLSDQKAEAARQVTELRAAVTDLQTSITALRSALDRAEKEVVRQKEKVAVANKRTLWAAVGGVIVGIFAAIAVSK